MANQRNKKANKVKAASEKKVKGGKKSHPPSSAMVLEAVAALNEKKGSSLQAIKKYITTNYQIDMSKQAFYIKKFIKSAVEDNELVQTKGNGVSGRFKLPAKINPQKQVQKSMPKKPPSKKQAPIKPTGATKKSDAHKNSTKVNVREKPKSLVGKKGGKQNGFNARQSSARTKSSKK